MLIVDKKTNTIQLTRGDTARLGVDLVSELEDGTTQPYSVQSDDVLTLSVKKRREDFKPCIEKVVKGSANFHIKPEDTAELEFGSYVYDVQIKTAEGDVCTVIENKTFKIGVEVSK
jgi:hypothetical protein